MFADSMSHQPVYEETAPPDFAGFDMVFSDRELSDILGFLEKQQTDGTALDPAGPLPFMMPEADSRVALQFQPHMIPDEPGLPSSSGTPSPSHVPATQPGRQSVVKTEDFVFAAQPSTSLPGPASEPFPSRPSLSLPEIPTSAGSGSSSGLVTAALDELALHSGDFPLSQPQPKPYANARPAREPTKQHISHSSVEKQRRDRINSLIDELRDLVPPQSNAAAESLDTKRPKHVVLSDTIQLVKELQGKGRTGDSTAAIKAEGAKDLIQRSFMGSAQAPGVKPVKMETSSSYELPSAPAGAAASSGVVVEQGDHCLYVKVNCRDRRGLLTDLIVALKAMQLEITTAAITTTEDGNVYDVFQVKYDAESGITPQDIQCHVHAHLYSNLGEVGDKRRRMVS